MMEESTMSEQVIEISPNVLNGTPVFKETRVPIGTLIDYLGAGDSLDEFLTDFPTVSREQALVVLDTFR